MKPPLHFNDAGIDALADVKITGNLGGIRGIKPKTQPVTVSPQHIPQRIYTPGL